MACKQIDTSRPSIVIREHAKELGGESEAYKLGSARVRHEKELSESNSNPGGSAREW